MTGAGVKAAAGAFSGEESRAGSSRTTAGEVRVHVMPSPGGCVCLGLGRSERLGCSGLFDGGEIPITLNQQFKTDVLGIL